MQDPINVLAVTSRFLPHMPILHIFFPHGLPTIDTVVGNFSKDSNELFINDSTRIMMEKRDSGLYQVLYINNKQIIALRFDLVMGAVKGQTYLSWHDKGLFQLPVSYITALHQVEL